MVNILIVFSSHWLVIINDLEHLGKILGKMQWQDGLLVYFLKIFLVFHASFSLLQIFSGF